MNKELKYYIQCRSKTDCSKEYYWEDKNPKEPKEIGETLKELEDLNKELKRKRVLDKLINPLMNKE